MTAPLFMDVFNQEWENTIYDKFQEVTQSGALEKITYGLLCGFFSGYALKRIGKLIAALIGIVFILLQILSYYGYITVDQDKITNDVQNMFSSSEWLEGLQGKTMTVLTYNLPAGGGFAAGFVLGFKIG